MKWGQGTLLDTECGHVWRTNHGYRTFGAPGKLLNFQSAIRSLRAIQEIVRFVLKSKVWPAMADVDSGRGGWALHADWCRQGPGGARHRLGRYHAGGGMEVDADAVAIRGKD